MIKSIDGYNPPNTNQLQTIKTHYHGVRASKPHENVVVRGSGSPNKTAFFCKGAKPFTTARTADIKALNALDRKGRKQRIKKLSSLPLHVFEIKDVARRKRAIATAKRDWSFDAGSHGSLVFFHATHAEAALFKSDLNIGV